MDLLEGLIINQAPAQARISPERGLYWAERRRGDGCYSMGWAGAYQTRMGVSVEVGGQTHALQALYPLPLCSPRTQHLILSAVT